jgi:hypothetical protein
MREKKWLRRGCLLLAEHSIREALKIRLLLYLQDLYKVLKEMIIIIIPGCCPLPLLGCCAKWLLLLKLHTRLCAPPAELNFKLLSHLVDMMFLCMAAGVLDPITLEPVICPAISPAGHVMGLATWRAVLAENPRCPFTKAPLRPDQLIVLTKHNIDKYRDRVIKP